MKYVTTFSCNNGLYTTTLSLTEFIKRRRYLDTLRVLTEGYEDGEGRTICEKAWKAYNKHEMFTGIIRLTRLEKEFLMYCLDSDMNTEEDIEVLQFYSRV